MPYYVDISLGLRKDGKNPKNSFILSAVPENHKVDRIPHLMSLGTDVFNQFRSRD